MTNRIQRGDLQVSEELDKLISEKVCVNIDVEPEQFWNSFNEVVKEFTPRNKALLAEREELQTKTGWGHSSIQQGIDFFSNLNCGEIIISHHAPYRTDAELDIIEQSLPTDIHLAKDGQVLKL